MVVAIKEHVLIGIMQQILKCRYRLAFKPGRPEIVLSVPALTSRTAGYVTRSSGGVGGALSDGRPYPYRWLINQFQNSHHLFIFIEIPLSVKKFS